MQFVVGDSLPTKLPRRNLVLARDGAEDWCVGFRCPCGCGRTVELLVIDEADPRWDISTDDQRRPTLTPSVWLRDGCRSHFLIQRGRVKWCE
jgi:Family of unknown function (DUF6527)